MKTSPIPITLGYIMSSRLKEIGKNQIWLANKCNVTKSQICKIIHNKVTPSLKLLSKIASSLSIEEDKLIRAITDCSKM